MTQNKYFPWLDQKKEEAIFDIDSSCIEMAISWREFFDYDYGLRFRGEAIRFKNWSVGFILEEALDNDEGISGFFEKLNKSGESSMIAIPSKEIGFELTGRHDVLEFFEPPLIARSKINMESFFQFRSSMVQMLRGSFFVFPEDNSAALLCNNGKYKMLAGARDFVEEVLGKSIEMSWEPVREKDKINPLLFFQMKQAMLAYGVSG